jgi:hypothetical protein
VRFVVHQCSAIQGAAVLAGLARWRRHYYMIEGDGLGACNWDRVSWLYERAAARLVPGLGDGRPEPELDEYEPDPPIEPTPVFVIRKPQPRATVGASVHLPKIILQPWEETLSP